MPAMTQEIMDAAYPTFYGEILISEDTPRDDGKTTTRVVYKPYNLEMKSSDGVLKDSFVWNEDALKLSYSDIHKYIQALATIAKVVNGDTAASVGYKGWFKRQPGQWGKIMPVPAPKGSTTPPAPEDWDRDAWLAAYREQQEATLAIVPTDVPEDLYPTILHTLAGTPLAKAVITLLSNDALATFDPPTLSRAVERLRESGELKVENGRFA